MSDEIEAEITYLPTEHGGRRGPVFSGYRPQFYYGGEDWDAIQTFVEAVEVQPGDTVTARLSSLNPLVHRKRIFAGMPFLVREGNRVVGYGRVTRLLDV